LYCDWLCVMADVLGGGEEARGESCSWGCVDWGKECIA